MTCQLCEKDISPNGMTVEGVCLPCIQRLLHWAQYDGLFKKALQAEKAERELRAFREGVWRRLPPVIFPGVVNYCSRHRPGDAHLLTGITALCTLLDEAEAKIEELRGKTSSVLSLEAKKALFTALLSELRDLEDAEDGEG
jgi:hypothetical protein